MKNILLTLIAAIGLAAGTTNASAQSRIVVTYFSATGTTRAAAQDLAKVMGADLYEITPAVPYTDADLNWRDKKSRSTVEMKNPNSRPAIGGTKFASDKYDVVFIGFPVWWYVAPTIINTFIEAYDLSGKTIIPFATSGGSPIENCEDQLRKTYPKLNWRHGELLNDADARTLQSWKKELGL